MTDAPAAAATQTPSTATPAAGNDTPAPAATVETPAADTATTGDAPADTDKNLPGADETATGDKDSADKNPAQGDDQADTDDANKDNQSSEDKDAKDTDKKDAEAKDKEDGNQDAQPQYEAFTMPEGMELDADALNEATPVLRELGADQAKAQKLVDVAASMLSKAAKNMADQHSDVVKGWQSETLKRFGNDGDAKFQEKVGRAEEVVKQFFSPEERKVLTHYGLGNHPAFFSMALAIAEGTGEDRGASPNRGAGDKGQKTLGQIWYPDQT